MKKAIIYIACIGLCLATGWFIYNGMLNSQTSDQGSAGYSIARQIQYGFTLRNTTGRVIPLAEFWTYAPVKQSGLQRCTTLKANYPYELIVDSDGNQILYFKFKNLAPFSTRLLNIRAGLLLAAESSQPRDSLRPSDLKPEPYIESDHPAIHRVARNLKAEKATDTVNNIARWVSTNISYSGYSGQEHGAYYALKNKQGDCTEYADLFVALCRANKIPARRIGGYMHPESAVINSRDYHDWAEFYEGGYWKIADPQNKKIRQDQADYIAMQIIRGARANTMDGHHRFRFNGDGLKVTMN